MCKATTQIQTTTENKQINFNLRLLLCTIIKRQKKQNSLPGKNWNGEDAGRLDSLMASCSEVGGNKKGGKPSGIPGAREDKIFLFPAA